jgi:septum formation protein
MGFAFSVSLPLVADEMSFFDKKPFEQSIRSLALAKAESVAQKQPEALVLGGDTIVCLGTKVMGKPTCRDEAREMICALSGSIHEVYSGVALVCFDSGFAAAASARTSVSFRSIDKSEIEEYLDFGDYADKAGAYAIQGGAMSLIEGISGCYYNVVGLPVAQTIGLFKSYIRKDSGHDRQQQV